MNSRSWWVIFVSLNALSTLCYSQDRAAGASYLTLNDDLAQAMEIIISSGDTGARLQKACVLPGLLVAASLGLLAAAGGLYCNDKKRRSHRRRSLSVAREAPEPLGTDRASRVSRKKQRWLIVSGFACLLAGTVAGISAIQLHKQISAAKRVMMSHP